MDVGKIGGSTECSSGSGCIFCGSAAVTSRPMLPSWGQAVLHDRISPTHSALAADHQLTCTACADGWMARLTEQAGLVLAPLLVSQGATATLLSTTQQRAVAGWLCLTAMLTASLHRHCVIPRGDRARLRHTGLPPRNWAMFVGALNGREWSGACMHDPFRIEFSGNPSATPSPGASNPACNTQLLSTGFGPLFLHMLATPSWPLLDEFCRRSRAAGLVALWPTHRRFGVFPAPMRLPPDRVFASDSASRIADETTAYLRGRLGRQDLAMAASPLRIPA